ncbi:hypothetical protein [Streptomyces sp. NPDC041003]|uniref:hypothetical protein n=1 Tax=Streptomyces sp. NPDC041003 TaxID=3155730 RepID=UPI0034058304
MYLGAAPGVGKTYAMLSEAHRRRLVSRVQETSVQVLMRPTACSVNSRTALSGPTGLAGPSAGGRARRRSRAGV